MRGAGHAFAQARLEGEYVVASVADIGEARLPRPRLEALAASIGESIEIDGDTVDGAEHLAKLYRDVLLDFPGAIRIFLKILGKFGHRSDIYHQLNGIYHYDIDAVMEFDLLGNALEQFAEPRADVDPIFYAYSYTYIGWLIDRKSTRLNSSH